MTFRKFIINPGSGPVEPIGECTLANAIANMRKLVEETLTIPQQYTEAERQLIEDPLPRYHGSCTVLRDGVGRGGRFGFEIRIGERTCLVEMPGLPLDRVRFTCAPKQNIWNFPRLYVDGCSWVWCYAAEALEEHFARELEIGCAR